MTREANKNKTFFESNSIKLFVEKYKEDIIRLAMLGSEMSGCNYLPSTFRYKEGRQLESVNSENNKL